MKNKKYFLFLLLLILSNFIQAQDFDIYPKLKDDNIKTPNLYENTLFNEYQLLSRNVRIMDMAYSIFVPGYIHFKAKDNKTAYNLLGIRLLGYSGIAANYLRMRRIDKNIGDIFDSNFSYNTDKIIFISSVTLMISSYLFDWIHGKARLEKKQELIRYRYGIKLKMNNIPQAYNKSNLTPSFYLTYTF